MQYEVNGLLQDLSVASVSMEITACVDTLIKSMRARTLVEEFAASELRSTGASRNSSKICS